jgi:hypothetical protein
MEDRALALLAFGPELATMLSHDLVRDGKPEAGALFACRARGVSSVDMPGPRSITEMMARASCCRVRTVTTDWGYENLIALDNRLFSACSIRVLSSIRGGRGESCAVTSVTSFLLASTLFRVTACSTRAIGSVSCKDNWRRPASIADTSSRSSISWSMNPAEERMIERKSSCSASSLSEPSLSSSSL